MTNVHVLHIGKTGGSAVKAGLLKFRDSHGLVLHSHDFKLRDVPEGDQAIFAVREPVGRFVSAFNSRLRKGQPRLLRDWRKKERKAFERFQTPNALAEALSSGDAATRMAAEDAMAGVWHVRHPISDWVTPRELEEREGDILFVMSQAELADDFEALKALLGLPADAALPTDEVVAHRTPDGFETGLSAVGRGNVEAWYAEDAALHRACLALRARKLAALESLEAPLCAEDVR